MECSSARLASHVLVARTTKRIRTKCLLALSRGLSNSFRTLQLALSHFRIEKQSSAPPHSWYLIMDWHQSATRQFQAELLTGTLLNAVRTPFYMSLWSGIDLSRITIDCLDELPLVSKDSLRLAGREAQMRDALMCDEIFSSGTTGRTFISVRGHREQDFIKKFYRETYGSAPPTQFLRGLQINNPFHAYQVPVPSPVYSHRVSIYDKGAFEYAASVLTSTHSDAMVEPDCTILGGWERCLNAFCDYASSKIYLKDAFKLKCVCCYGSYLTSQTRCKLESVFGCPVVDRFSLSEVFGAAKQCLDCGWYHFDPMVVAEVVSPKDKRPIVEGRGILVLTSMYPFQEAQPLVRYYTSDIVDVTFSKSCRPGILAFRPVGREKYSVPDSDGYTWLLTSSELYEVIDSDPSIQRMPLFLDSDEVVDHLAAGFPRYGVKTSFNQGIIEIVVEVILKEGSGGYEVTQAIRRRLLEKCENLSYRVEQGSAVLQVEASQHIEAQFWS